MVRTSIRLSADFILLMGSSPGFGSRPSDKSALFGLAFATAPAINCFSHAAENEVVGSLGKRNAVTRGRFWIQERLMLRINIREGIWVGN